jgi:hypothetical protein
MLTTNDPLSKEEFKQMLALIQRYSETSMDQWETWKVKTVKGMLFIDLRLAVPGPESAYTDVSEVLTSQRS